MADNRGAAACEVWWSTPLPAAPEFLAVLDDTERGRYEAYRKPADRRRFLTGRVLAKAITGRRLDLSPADVVLDATCEDCGKPHGRPWVHGFRDRIHLSITHSGDRVGLAVTDGVPVGLDVEATSRESIEGLIDYALNDEERAAFDLLDERAREQAFFVAWARKEALMKACGRGLKIPLRSLTLAPPGEPARLVESYHDALRPTSTQLIDLKPGDGYRASVAVLATGHVDVTEQWWTV